MISELVRRLQEEGDETFSELRGLTVGAHQTVGLAKLVGMKVED